MGLYALMRREGGALASRALIGAMFWVITLYFLWHSLHARVEANWFAPVYPALAIAAAVAASLTRWDRVSQRVADFCLRWAAPVGILMFAALIVQADTGVLSGFRRDATVRSVGVGWPALAAEIEATRARVGASCVLAPDYGTASWLVFLSPEGHLRGAADPAHPLGRTWPSPIRPSCRASFCGSTKCAPASSLT